MQGNLSVERMCALAMVSRAGFYRSFHEREPDLEEMELRSAIQAIVVEHKLRYGYRRVTAELRHRGFLANHKRVVRLMRLDNLLSIRRSAFVTTTDSDHEFEVHLNLASRMQLSGINQLWLADITFVRLQQEFVYLAVVLDAFSRKVVGWALDRTAALSALPPSSTYNRGWLKSSPRFIRSPNSSPTTVAFSVVTPSGPLQNLFNYFFDAGNVALVAQMSSDVRFWSKIARGC